MHIKDKCDGNKRFKNCNVSEICLQRRLVKALHREYSAGGAEEEVESMAPDE